MVQFLCTQQTWQVQGRHPAFKNQVLRTKGLHLKSIAEDILIN